MVFFWLKIDFRNRDKVTDLPLTHDFRHELVAFSFFNFIVDKCIYTLYIVYIRYIQYTNRGICYE